MYVAARRALLPKRIYSESTSGISLEYIQVYIHTPPRHLDGPDAVSAIDR